MKKTFTVCRTITKHLHLYETFEAEDVESVIEYVHGGSYNVEGVELISSEMDDDYEVLDDSFFTIENEDGEEMEVIDGEAGEWA